MVRTRSQDRQFTLSDLPVDLLYYISHYLSSVECHLLSEVCVILQQIYRPLVYRRCKVSDVKRRLIVPINCWFIPPNVLFNPSKYSWFPNEVVRVIITDKGLTLDKLKKIKLSKYPQLQSISLPAFDIMSCLVITDKKRNFFGRRKFDLKDTPVFSTDYMPLIISKETLYPIKLRAMEKSYALHCENLDTRMLIKSLDICMSDPDERKPSNRITFPLKKIHTFPNLTDLKIRSTDRCDFDTFQAVLSKLPKFKKLKNLIITHFYLEKNERYMKLFDNLSGSWETFNLCIFFKGVLKCHLRLPNVTNLELYDLCEDYCDDEDSGFDIKLDFGNRLERLSSRFETDTEFLTKYHTCQNVLETITRLKVFIPTYTVISENTGEEMIIFNKELPNLKEFEFKSNDFNPMEGMFMLLEGHFEQLSSTLHFGEFDILNYKLIEPLIQILKEKSLKENWLLEGEENLNTVNECVDSLRNATKNPSLFGLYKKFYRLQLGSCPCLCGEVDDDAYITVRALLSVIFLQVLQYLPNLETLNLSGMKAFEEYPALHYLIKHHKNLKTVTMRIEFEPYFGDPRELDDSWQHAYSFKKDYQIMMDEGIVYLKPYESVDDTTFIRFDVDGYHNYINPKLLLPDWLKRQDDVSNTWNDFGYFEFAKTICLFSETLSVNYNDSIEYEWGPIRQSYLDEYDRLFRGHDINEHFDIFDDFDSDFYSGSDPEILALMS